MDSLWVGLVGLMALNGAWMTAVFWNGHGEIDDQTTTNLVNGMVILMLLIAVWIFRPRFSSVR